MSTVTDLLEQQTLAFEKEMKKVIRHLEVDIATIIDKFKTVEGVIIPDANLVRVLTVGNQIETALRNSGYYELAEKALTGNKKLMELEIKNLERLLGRKRLGEIDSTTINNLLKVKFQGMVDQAGLNIIAIKETMFNSVTLGLPMSMLREGLTGKLGRFKSYANTYIRTSKREFIQTVEDSVADQIGFGEDKDDIWEYLPSLLQSNSHKECIWAVGKRYFTNAQKIEFEAGGGYSHSEPRWNCIHYFAITNKTYDEVFGEK